MQKQQSTSKRSKDIKSTILSTVLTLAILFILGRYLQNNREIFSSLQNVKFSYLVLLILINVIYILVLSYLNKMVFHKLKPEIKTYEIVSLQFINNLLNKILPKGGVAYRAMYLKKHYRLPYSYFLVSFTGIVVLSLASQALISIGTSLLIYLQTGSFNVVIFVGFLGILLGSLSIMILKPSIPQKTNWILNKIRSLIEAWKVIVENKKDLVIFFSTSVMILFIDALNIYSVFFALKYPINYSEAIILSSLSSILSYINITPDGLGIREGVYLYMSSILTVSEPQILIGSLVQRGISLLTSLIFGGVSYLILLNSQKNIKNNA